MANVEKQKIKIMKLYEILNMYSDESNPISTNEIISRLKDEGINCKRKALYDDIDTLNRYGYEIECVRKRQNEYYILGRKFDIPELKILIDAVQASNFITIRKSSELINKIANLAGTFKGEVLTKNVLYQKNIKKTNEKIFYSIDAIHNAISEGRKINFRYFDTAINGDVIYRRNGEPYIINPVKLTISDNQYYLICYDDKHASLTNYRVDRMDNVTVTDIPKSFYECEKEEFVEKYTEGLFQMFNSKGKKQKIDLKIKNNSAMVDIILDKFGKNIVVTKTGEDFFYIRVNVMPGPTFYSWLTTFKGDIRINYPREIREEYIDFLKINLSSIE